MESFHRLSKITFGDRLTYLVIANTGNAFVNNLKSIAISCQFRVLNLSNWRPVVIITKAKRGMYCLMFIINVKVKNYR